MDIYMSQLFKLQINEYSLGEMQSLLNLESPYTLEDIVNNENCLREKLLVDGAVSATKKEEIITFLGLVKKKLMEDIKQGFKAKNTVVDNQHNVIRRPFTEKARTKVDNFIAPNLKTAANMLPDAHLKRTLLCLDSRFRDNYYTTLSTDYHLTLPTKVKNVISMELVALEFPNTYYQISKSLGNNFFWMGWSAPMGAVMVAGKISILNWFYISIPDGNYRRADIQKVINEQITYATSHGLRETISSEQPGPTGGGLNGIKPPQCIIDAHSIKTVFAVTVTVGQQLELRFNGSRGDNTTTNTTSYITPPDLDLGGVGGIISNFGWILGYRMAEYTSSQAYVSEGCYDGWGTKYLYIVIDDYNMNVNNYVIPSYNSSIGKANILARISTTSAASDSFSQGLSLNNDFINPDISIKKRDYFGPVDIQRLHLQVIDEFGRILDLNNMDLAIGLDLVSLYD